MDDTVFDALARTFAATRSRRAVVRALAGTAGGGLLALVGRGGADAASCKKPNTACGKGKTATCTNLGADPKNCGTCGTVCAPVAAGATATCQNGVCASACPDGQTICNWRGSQTCVDFSSDPRNCGTCGFVCTTDVAGASSICVAGDCVSLCPPSLTDCGNGCIDTQGTDLTNCGACGHACSGPVGAIMTCENGVCASACPAGQFVCAGRCVDHAECCGDADCPHLQRCGYFGGEMICYCQVSCVFTTPSGGCPDGIICVPFGENSVEGFCSTGNFTGFSDGGISCPDGYEFGMLHFGTYGCFEVRSCPPGVPQA